MVTGSSAGELVICPLERLWNLPPAQEAFQALENDLNKKGTPRSYPIPYRNMYVYLYMYIHIHIMIFYHLFRSSLFDVHLYFCKLLFFKIGWTAPLVLISWTRALELSKILSFSRSKISWNCHVETSVPLMRFTSETTNQIKQQLRKSCDLLFVRALRLEETWVKRVKHDEKHEETN